MLGKLWSIYGEHPERDLSPPSLTVLKEKLNCDPGFLNGVYTLKQEELEAVFTPNGNLNGLQHLLLLVQ